MLLATEVSKLDKSSIVNPLHLLNMYAIVVTLDVSKLDNSKDVNALQFSSMQYIVVTLDVLKLDKSRDLSELQPLNMLDMLVENVVSIFPNPSIVTSLVNPLNQNAVDSGNTFIPSVGV